MGKTRALVKIFYQPSRVFQALLEKPSWMVVGVLVISFIYINHVLPDIHRFYKRDTPSEITTIQLVAINHEDEAKQETGLKQSAEGATVVVERIDDDYFRVETVREETLKDALWPAHSIHIVLGLLFFLILIFLEALYFKILATAVKLRLSIRHWLAFTVWSRVPSMCLLFLTTLLAGVVFGSPKALQGANLLAMQTWIDMPDVGNETLGISFENVSAGLVWVLVLQTIGFKIWSQRSSALSAFVVLAPTVILYGGALTWWLVA